jgi:hypothetical protein
MHNRVLRVSEAEIGEIMKSVDDDTFVVNIRGGGSIQSWMEFAEKMKVQFDFPRGYWDFVIEDAGLGLMRYYDWMTDLYWVKENKIIVTIHQYSAFMMNNLALKKEILTMFKDDILPFWEEEVVHVVVEGQPRSFMLYLTDELDHKSCI